MTSIGQIVKNTKSEEAAKAKQNLIGIVEKINPVLDKYFNSEIRESFGVSKRQKALSRLLWEHIKEHNLRPAKRLRASFVYYGYKLFGGRNENAILEAASGIELIHTALLMHDDFMDQDKTRRGRPTTQEYFRQLHKTLCWKGSAAHFGESMAVDVGDVALMAGFEILGWAKFDAIKKLKAQNQLLRGIINTGLGQAFDISLEVEAKATEKDVLDLHWAKTAVYTYQTPLLTGAILAGAKEKDLVLLVEYAKYGGVAFQLQDDILGCFGDEEKTGKAADSDLREGKMTLLYIKAKEKAEKTQAKELEELWGRSDMSSKQARRLREIIMDTGSLEYSKNVSRAWAAKAKKVAGKMLTKGWNKEAVEYLAGIAQYMVERDM